MSTKFRLIAFNAAMIAALDAGRKTQTRRKIEKWSPLGYERLQSQGVGHSFAVGGGDYHCPYGGPGTVLVVKEPWAVMRFEDDKKPADISPWVDEIVACTPRLVFHQDFGERFIGKARVARFMPYWAGRRYLVLEKVRYEPVSWITEEDSAAEGISPNWGGLLGDGPDGTGGEGWKAELHGYIPHDMREDGSVPGCDIYDDFWIAKRCFARLWESIHGAGAWAVPTMVWALSFRSVVAGSEEWQGLRAELLDQAAERFERNHAAKGRKG